MVELAGRADLDQTIFDPDEQPLGFRDGGGQILDVLPVRLLSPTIRKIGIDLNDDVNFGIDGLRGDHHPGFGRMPALGIEHRIERTRKPSAYEVSTGLRTMIVDSAAALAGPAMPAPCPTRPVLHPLDRQELAAQRAGTAGSFHIDSQFSRRPAPASRGRQQPASRALTRINSPDRTRKGRTGDKSGENSRVCKSR